jgi:hypothetical protein
MTAPFIVLGAVAYDPKVVMKRLQSAGFSVEEAARLSALHTPNFM